MCKVIMLTWILSLSVFSIVQAQEGQSLDGKVGTGGSSSVLIKGNRVLLDFYEFELHHSQKIPGSPLLKGNAKSEYLIDVKSQIAWIDAQIKIKEWKKRIGYHRFFNVLQHSMEELNVIVTEGRLNQVSHQFYLPRSFEYLIPTVKTIAYYDKDFGVLLSKPGYQELNYRSQIGLWIHEGLRNMQRRNKIEMSNHEIQKLTHAFVNESPRPLKELFNCKQFCTELNYQSDFKKAILNLCSWFDQQMVHQRINPILTKSYEFTQKYCLVDIKFQETKSQNDVSELIYWSYDFSERNRGYIDVKILESFYDQVQPFREIQDLLIDQNVKDATLEYQNIGAALSWIVQIYSDNLKGVEAWLENLFASGFLIK